MFGKHIIRQLSAYHHGELSGRERLRVEAHLQVCSKCRAAHEEIRFGASLASTLSVSNAPETVAAVYDRRSFPRDRYKTGGHRPPLQWARRVVLAGALVATVILAVVLTRNHFSDGPSWEVTGVPGTSRIRPGETLQTGPSSEAQIKIANIGQLTIDPNTRIRLLQTQPGQHRIALDRGRLEATTWAPPRLFIVETPTASAIDLGCKYTLEVQEDESSLLHVTLGLVALERGGRETIVPAGAFCRTRPGAGPGTPFFEDSSTRFQAALEAVDSTMEGAERTRQLEIALGEARIRDALSLWHLLPRLDAQSRGRIYDRLAGLLPPPSGVTREGIIALDPKALDAWEKIVSQLWQ